MTEKPGSITISMLNGTKNKQNLLQLRFYNLKRKFLKKVDFKQLINKMSLKEEN